MKRFFIIIAAVSTLMLAAGAASAHFGMIIPDQGIVSPDNRTEHLTLSFSHPFEGVGMDLVKPKKFSVWFEGEETDLLDSLTPATVMDHQAWQADYAVRRPGMYVFAMEPEPYPEPAEDNYIIHYTKVVVSGFDAGEDWNTPIGAATEIVPLTRPWGNYAGNVFVGQVLVNGVPAPFTRVEVEYYNPEGRPAPFECMITQEVLCDQNGVFVYACPVPGWWGFAGLNTADYQIEGKEVEIGAVLWTEMLPFPAAP